MKKIAIVLVSFLFAACASTSKLTPPKEAANSPPTVTISEAATASVPEKSTSVSPISSSDIEARRLADEAKRKADEAQKAAAELQALQRKSVYFDFDKYVVKPEYVEVVRQQAEFIKMHKNDFVTVEGNTDERGSGEYNLALGDRRAEAVRKNLEILGVPAAQIRAVSFGEEKPRLTCHEEKCWQEDRRDDFVHKLN